MLDVTMSDPTRSDRLPVLDLSRFDGTGSDRAAFLAEVRAAARGAGFFYLTGHGIPAELIRELRDPGEALFRAARGRQARHRNGELAAFPRL